MVYFYRAKHLIVAILVVFISFSVVGLSVKAASTSIFRPIESTKVLNNPLMGWAPDARDTTYVQPHKLVLANIKWSELEPQKGIYNFSYIESKFNFSYWHQKNVKIIFRVVLDYPSSISHKDIPDWLYTEMNGAGTWYDTDYGKGFSPDYENSTLISYHQKLIATLGQRYNKSGDIAFVQLGSLGHWGEWHTKQDSTIFIPFPKEEIANKYVNHYIASFPDKLLLMRRPFNIAKANNMGLFNDMFGDRSETDRYLSWIRSGYYNRYVGQQEPAMPDFWKTAPSGGEFANGSAYLKYFKSDTINDTIYQAQQTHISWLGTNCPANQPLNTILQPNFDSLLKTIGYRFVLTQASYSTDAVPGKSTPVTININNKGIAPFYYKWPVKLYLIDSKGTIINTITSKEDVRTWLPGTKTFTTNVYIPSLTKAGSYKLAVGIIDPATGKPSVDFANEGKLSGGYYNLGNINIKR